ncbi:ricin B lectin domain-containing protein [Cyathus striatus]|nr:ricin B lectin domain-containing protein [Cyathus striatus]
MLPNSLALLLPLLAIPPAIARQYTVINSCPTPINFFLAGAFQKILTVNGTVAHNLSDDTGFFYTDVNGGSSNGSGTTRAGFLLEPQYRYYHMVVDPEHFNVGMSITPSVPQNGGYCPEITCNNITCKTAFTAPPSHISPPPFPQVPTPPMYSCLDPNASYTITFCPSGRYPPPQGEMIHPNGNSYHCLDVRGDAYANGTSVQIYDCNNTPSQRWFLNRGSTKVQLTGTNFCLDAGAVPDNGAGVTIWQCYDNIPSQAWYYTDDNRIVLENQGQCLDLPNGNVTNGVQAQTRQCTDFNPNQIWTI